jgi:uncharacterized protein (TIGR02996 family)
MDDESFLRAINARPDDNLPRLVYADWLEERHDTRADVVRIQAQLRELQPDDESRAELLSHLEKLEAGFDPRWLVRVSPPVWCAVGNILNEDSSSDETLRDFYDPNAKVYLADLAHHEVVLNLMVYRERRIRVIVRNRHLGWTVTWIAAEATGKWRARRGDKWDAIRLLREVDWAGFRLPCSFHPSHNLNDDENLQAFFKAIEATMPTARTNIAIHNRLRSRASS